MPQSVSPREGDHPSETILKQFLNGNLTQDVFLRVEGHLATCAQCRSLLNHLVREDDAADASLVALTQSFARKGLASPLPKLGPVTQSYPDFETIAAYIDGVLSQSQVREFEALMRQTPRLVQEVAELRALKQNLQTAPHHERAIIATDPVPLLPPMIVRRAGVQESRGKTWWAQWRWPMQSLGIATVAFLLALVIDPLHRNEREQWAQRETQSNAQLRNSETALQRVQRKSAQENLKQANHIRQLQQQIQESKTQNGSLSSELQQSKEQISQLQSSPPSHKDTPSFPEPTQTTQAQPTPVVVINTPQIEGTAPSQPDYVNSDEGQMRGQSITLRYTKDGNTVHLDGGLEVGAVEGRTVELSGDKILVRGGTPENSAPPQQFQITRATINESQINVPDSFDLPAQGLARVIIPPIENNQLLVGLGQGVSWSDPIVKRLIPPFKSAFFRLAYPNEKPAIQLALGSRHVAFPVSIPVESKTASDQRGYYLVTSAGKPVPNFFINARPTNDIQADDWFKLDTQLKSLCVQLRLLALSNPLSESGALLRLVKVRPYRIDGAFDKNGDWSSTPGSIPYPLDPKEPLAFKVGDGVQFGFENKFNQPLYLTLLWLAQDGSITPMSGTMSKDSPVIRLAPKGTTRSSALTMRYGMSPPSGVEHLSLFVSKRPINVALLKFDITEKSMIQPTGTPSPLDLMLAGIQSTRIRSKSSVPIDFRTWATITHEIRIREK